MAEAVRFELTEESPLRRFSSLSLNSRFTRVSAGFRFRNLAISHSLDAACCLGRCINCGNDFSPFHGIPMRHSPLVGRSRILDIHTE